jgi:hypothetical protein
MDARRRLEAPIPGNYFGNCMGRRVLVAERNELLGEDGVAVAVKACGEAITSLDGVMSWAENWLPMVLAIRRLMGQDMLALPGHLGLSFTALILGGEGQGRWR